ncbi:hypothetical protein PAAG_04843 [Paracoccidioides lutzii Pb01]|uniref:Uncharacterized protein n=1 Tax=Paracoccidioides lutzii (strain ATCC MYA-826 / Pb01) TaxID=502779 RepID=C1H1Q7_PARBA|nr:hypothetical protein PAAG_04843 [Paracoccidioides lutzii Pb01]EEH33794.2 hypothetical protein PAAG_04843 [Paracoccidioides lutzii Pb01]
MPLLSSPPPPLPPGPPKWNSIFCLKSCGRSSKIAIPDGTHRAKQSLIHWHPVGQRVWETSRTARLRHHTGTILVRTFCDGSGLGTDDWSIEIVGWVVPGSKGSPPGDGWVPKSKATLYRSFEAHRMATIGRLCLALGRRASETINWPAKCKT